jgi:hypothetical protein
MAPEGISASIDGIRQDMVQGVINRRLPLESVICPYPAAALAAGFVHGISRPVPCGPSEAPQTWKILEKLQEQLDRVLQLCDAVGREFVAKIAK